MIYPAIDDMKNFHAGAGWYRFLGEKKNIPTKTKKKHKRRATKPVIIKPADGRRTEQGFKNRLKKERLHWLVRGF